MAPQYEQIIFRSWILIARLNTYSGRWCISLLLLHFYMVEFAPELLTDSKRVSTCEVQAELQAHQVLLKCIFSSDIEGFSVIYNNSEF